MRPRHPSVWPSSQRGYLTLIGLLVVIVIIGILFVVLYGGGGGGAGSGSGVGGTGGTPLGASVRTARGTVCKNNLNQLRLAINMFVNANDRYPSSLEELHAGIPPTCPDGGEPYQYDPTTGEVRCVHPGHERFSPTPPDAGFP